MAVLNRSVATLRIQGEDLDPDQISQWLGAQPTSSQKKGKPISFSKSGRIARFGMWMLETPEREPADVDAQIREMLGQLTQNLAAWKYIAGEYRIDLFCGWFLKRENEGISISPESLLALGSRGILIDMDIYSGTDGEE